MLYPRSSMHGSVKVNKELVFGPLLQNLIWARFCLDESSNVSKNGFYITIFSECYEISTFLEHNDLNCYGIFLYLWMI